MRRSRLLLLLAIMMTACSVLHAQYGFSVSTPKMAAATRLSDGNFLCAMASPGSDLQLTWLNSSGEHIQSRTVSLPGHLLFKVGALHLLDSEHVLVTAQGTDSLGGVDRDHLIRVNTSTLEGQIVSVPVWSYKGVPEVIVKDPFVYITYSDFQRSRLEKRDLALNPIFTDTILLDTLGKLPNQGFAVHDTNVVIIAKTFDECTLYRLNTDGDLLDHLNFQESGYTRVYDIVFLPDGDFVICGFRGVTLSVGHKAILCRMNLAGDVVWAKEVDTLMDNYTMLRLLPDGRLAAFGNVNKNVAGWASFNAVSLFDQDGNLERTVHFATSADDEPSYYSLEMLPDGFLMGGSLTMPPSTYLYPLTFTDFSFSQVCNQTELSLTTSVHEMGTLQHLGLSVATNHQGVGAAASGMEAFVAVTGEGTTPLCSPVLGIPVHTQSPFTIFPNPLHEGDPFQIRLQEPLDWTIHDATGRIILRGKGSTTVQTAGWANGMYMARLQDGKTQRLLVR